MDVKGSEKYLDMLLGRYKEFGFDEAQAAFVKSIDKTVTVRDGQIESFENSDNQKLMFEGLKNGHLASSASNLFDDESVEFLLQNTSENCDILTEKDEDFIYCHPDKKDWEVLQKSPNAADNTYSEYERLSLILEKKLLECDPSVKSVEMLSMGGSETESIKKNTKGLRIIKNNSEVSVLAEVSAEKDGVVKNAGNFWNGREIKKFESEMDDFVRELKEDLMGKFGGSPVPSGKYEVLLDREAVVSLFGVYFGALSELNMQKGLSLLKDKEGEKIASDCFTLREEPMYEKAMDKFPLDGENYPTSAKAFIENGVFKTALYTLKSANKAGKEPTGNGFGSSGGPANVIIDPGTRSPEEIFSDMKDGLYIRELSGLHAGANPLSGDFSLLCEGYLIKDGKKDRYVEQITCSGNFFNLLKDIKEVSNDVKSFPGSCEFFSVSLRIGALDIAGEG